MKLQFNMRTVFGSMSNSVVYRAKDIDVLMGDWTSIETPHMVFHFDSEAIWPVGQERPWKSLAHQHLSMIRTRIIEDCHTTAARIMLPHTLMEVMQQLPSLYAAQRNLGREQLQAELRALLGA